MIIDHLSSVCPLTNHENITHADVILTGLEN